MTVAGDWEGFGFLGGALSVALVFVLLLIVGLIAFFILGKLVGGPTPPAASTAQRLLDERYARGEVSRDEYLERRAVLSGQMGPTT